MKILKPLLAVLLLGTGLLIPPALAQTAKAPTTQVLTLKSVPDGHYLVNLELGGAEGTANFEVKAGQARCVRSNHPKLKNLQGDFELIGNGVFLISLQSDRYRATQYWLFREDGGAVIREIPDRGEQQSAVRVTDDSLTSPAK